MNKNKLHCMPLQKAKGRSKKAVQKAVSSNIAELYKANELKPDSKKRPVDQIKAIAYAAATRKKKKR